MSTALTAGHTSVGRRDEALILATCVLANFMAYGTFAALSVAVPAMSRDLDGGVATASWMVLSFLLAMSATILVFAKLTDELGRRWFYIGGILVYTLCSLVCVVSSNEVVLIAMRVVQGAAAAASMSTSTAVITDVFPLPRLPTAMGIFMSMAGASSVLGPVLGGALIDHYGWRSIFWASVVFGALAMVTGWEGLKHVHAPRSGGFSVDVPGSLTSILGITALVYGVQAMGGGELSRPVIAVALLVSVLSLVTFWRVERVVKRPLVDLSVVTGPRAGLYLSALGTAMGSNGLVVMATLYLQVMDGATAAAAGAFMLPMGVSMLVGSPLSGVLQRWTTQRLLSTWSALAIGASTTLAAIVAVLDAPTSLLWPLLVVSGLGQGLYHASLSGRLMAGIAPNRRGIANGMRAMLVNGSTAVSTALVIAVITLMAGEDAIKDAVSDGARPAFVLAGLVLGAAGLAGAFAAWCARPEAEGIR